MSTLPKLIKKNTLP